jgi:hypothetical protein
MAQARQNPAATTARRLRKPRANPQWVHRSGVLSPPIRHPAQRTAPVVRTPLVNTANDFGEVLYTRLLWLA